MTDEYAAVKRGKLILKGDKPKAKKRKHKKKDKTEDDRVDEDCIEHGGWWKVERIEDVSGSIAIEFGDNRYLSALDSGLFAIGPARAAGEAPAPEEILTALPAGDGRVALKSGYGKYLGVSKEGTVIGRSDAVGPLERWEPVWQDGYAAILSAWGAAISSEGAEGAEGAAEGAAAVGTRRGPVSARSACRVRSSRARATAAPARAPAGLTGLAHLEVDYVRKFQKFQDKKLRINEGGALELKRAKTEGNLHETLLDRRSKMKADRYCK